MERAERQACFVGDAPCGGSDDALGGDHTDGRFDELFSTFGNGTSFLMFAHVRHPSWN
jgi:hypothetical protein